MANQRWSDLSPRKRRAIIAAGVVQNSLLAAALIDIKRRPAREIKGSKRRWFALSLISWAGPISYFAFGRRD